MKRKTIALLGALAVGLLALTMLWGSAVPVAAGPVVQVTPRPQLTPTPGVSLSAQAAPRPPRLRGTVLDWGKGNMPAGVKVVLSGDGWEIPVQTDMSGEYIFQDIGNEVAFLNALVPSERGELAPLTSDLPVRVSVDGELIVNVAFYPKGSKPDPILDLDVVASSPDVAQDEDVSYTITVVNNRDEGVNQVIVADPLPEGMTYVQASASQGSVTYDRGLVWAELGTLAGNDKAMVMVVARVDADVAPGTVIVNKVAAYHSENVAVQSQVETAVIEHSNGRLPVTGLVPWVPLSGIFLVVAALVAYRLRRVPE